ncbi:phage scaffolding protein [Streptomyces sp. NPDC102462]|uniref:phage scaffolding protein n=1 Tax=Streptomyces sp. NPDC102462 TaxID=3366178 RepID=UPI00381B9B6C
MDENEIEAIREALKKANEEAKTYRLESKALKEQIETMTSETQTLKTNYVQTKAQDALRDAGLTNAKASKFIDYSKVSVTETGELEGLTEQLDALKEDLPELFNTQQRVSGGADAADKREARPQKSSADILAAKLLKG